MEGGLSNREIKTTEQKHVDLQTTLDEDCFGIMDQEPIYKKGRLVNRLWHCQECGETLTEKEVLEIEEKNELERMS